MLRISSVKELQTTCNDLYEYFTERLSQVTKIERIESEYWTDICFHNANTKNCLKITKWINGDLWFWDDDTNVLMFSAFFNQKDMSIVKAKGSRFKQYRSEKGQKTIAVKKRTILLDLRAKLETLFKDYL